LLTAVVLVGLRVHVLLSFSLLCAQPSAAMADLEKELGNTQFKAGNYDQAIVHFTRAIEMSPTHVLFSNRSACYCGLRKYDDALADSSKCIEMKGDWGKGYGRKGAALHGLGRFDEAIAAYEKGLDVEPGLAMLTNGLAEAKTEASKGGSGGLGGIGNVFAAPDVISKIVSNPQTAPFLADPYAPRPKPPPPPPRSASRVQVPPCAVICTTAPPSAAARAAVVVASQEQSELPA
jgi:tetratricopeptide (TPR) repeat protein